ncbi:MAG: mannosyl-3-phosphoglycerate phosphatase [Chloroflexi bacterium]|nr:mannosyl-3-phosphoglycerate phosphatase [Chloroflexota bacterium]
MEKQHQSELVIFTDLDGTLLDRVTYSYNKAITSVKHLLQKEIPVIFCSSKTRAEQEVYRRELGFFHPFIVENGGAIFIPEGYFQFKFDYNRIQDGYQMIELGIAYSEIRRILEQIRSDVKVDFRGFGDMSDREVAADTGLDLEAARRAKEREYAGTLKLEGTPDEVSRTLGAIKEAGLNYVFGGRYYSIMGPNDKGRATKILINLFQRKLGHLKTVGIGDSPNDLPMLLAVDIPVLVQGPEGGWEEADIPHLRRVEGIGPEAWARAVEEIILVHDI